MGFTQPVLYTGLLFADIHQLLLFFCIGSGITARKDCSTFSIAPAIRASCIGPSFTSFSHSGGPPI